MKLAQILNLLKVGAAFVVLWAGMWGYSTFGCHKVSGTEMTPTLAPDKIKFTVPRVTTTDQLQVDDLVFFEYRYGKALKDVAARVVALPGDRVRIDKGVVHVNGQELISSYGGKKQASDENYAELLVPRDTVFLLCDNRRTGSRVDSRSIGPVHVSAITAKVR